MKTTMDKSGRLVIPKEIRRRAGIEAGMELDIRCADGRIEIEPAPVPVKLVRKGRLLVLVSDGQLPPMPADIVERARRERDEEIAGLKLDDH